MASPKNEGAVASNSTVARGIHNAFRYAFNVPTGDFALLGIAFNDDGNSDGGGTPSLPSHPTVGPPFHRRPRAPNSDFRKCAGYGIIPTFTTWRKGKAE